MPANARLRVLVTGATGFLGRNIVNAILGREDLECIAACRDSSRLPPEYSGRVREGDLLDDNYRREVVQDVDVVCHAAAWASMWGHREEERIRFFEPTISLIEHAIEAGVSRFIMAGSVVMGSVTGDGTPHDDFSPTSHTGFWPHLDLLVDIDRFMRENSNSGMQMVQLRLGHFVGRGNRLGMVPALLPRLRTRLVPWLAGGRKCVPLVADSDMGRAFALAATAKDLAAYESFNITGSEFPALREVIAHIAEKAGTPHPLFSVPMPPAMLLVV